MSWQYSWYFSLPSLAEHARAHDLGEADDGVERRAQLVAHIGEEFRLGLVGFLGAGLFALVFLGEIGELDRLPLQRGLRTLQVDDGGAQAQVVVDQLLLVLLDAGDVGADRDVAAVLGAALADVQPAAVVELGLEGARARALGRGLVVAGAHLRHAADFEHGLVGSAGNDGGVGQLVQTLEVRVAEHEAIARVPQHEGLRNGLDRVAKTEVGFHCLLGEALLLGDVDGDADQVHAGIGRAAGLLAADAEPDPVAVDMLHAEGLVDVVDLLGDELVGDREQVDVVGLHQRIDLAEGEEPRGGRRGRASRTSIATRRSGRATGPSPTGRSGRG